MSNLSCGLASPAVPMEIPVFFSTDDRYLPFLDIAVASLIDHASPAYRYRLVVLNTGLSPEGVEKVMRRGTNRVTIEFVDISKEVAAIQASLKDVYHFSVVTYYRLFIASLFPQYRKIVYLDSDLVLLGDVAELYHTDLHGCIIAAAPEQYVRNTPEFRLYAEKALDVNPDGYVNAGVLVIDLDEFRRHRIEERFLELITRYGFDLLDPDQAYLNYLCDGYIHVLPNGWNKEPMPLPLEGELNLVHYALYKKPWQYDDVMYGEHFWRYAETSPFCEEIRRRRSSFGEEERAQKEETAIEILRHALAIVESDNTFATRLQKK
jgi:lipopolysaccharide biosynthesis glycosyltransferase